MMFNKMLWAILVGSMASSLMAQDIDVYFIAGQSNAGNIGEQNGIGGGFSSESFEQTTNSQNVGFNFTYGRIQDQASDANGSSAPSNVVDFYSSSTLNPDQEVNQLAVALNAGTGNDIAIYTFARNGRALANQADANDGGESWYPGDGTTDFDSELYGDFQAWSSQRLVDLAAANPSSNVNVNGVFWFQGEGDVGIGSTAVNDYEDNFENLVDRFQDDFGQDVVVVATDLRSVGNNTQQGLIQQVDQSVANVAAANQLVGSVPTTVNADGTGVPLADRFGPGDVHFSDGAQEVIVQRWAAESLRLQALVAVPEPGTFGIGCFVLAVGAMRRRRVHA